MMPRGPSSSSSSSTSSAPTSNGGARSHGAPLWGRPNTTTTSSGAANSSTSIPNARSLSGSLGTAKPTSSAALARKRSRMEKFGSPPPFNPSPGPSAAGGTMTPDSRPVSSHSYSRQDSDSDLMFNRPMTAQGTMSSSHRQHLPTSHSSTTRARDRDVFSPTAAHVSHSRRSTTAGVGSAGSSSTSTSAAQQRFHPHNYHQTMPRPWASSSSASAAAAPSSSHHQPNVMHVSSSLGHHGHMDQDMEDELDEDVIMMSVDADLLNSGPVLPSSSSSGGPNSARQFAMPMTPRHQQQQQQHPPTPPASSSIVSRAPSFTSSYSSTHHRPHQHEPQYAPASTASPSTLNPHTHGAFPNTSHMHPPAPAPHAHTPRMTLDQIEAMLQSHLNELTSAFSDVRDVLAQSQWYISQHKQHVQDATSAASRERDRLSGAIRAKLVESQALISEPVGAAAARQRAASQEQTAEQNGQTQGETSAGGRGHLAPASVSLSPRAVEREGEGAGGHAQGTAYRDYVEQLELEEMLRSSPSPSNGAGGSPARTSAPAPVSANASGLGEGGSM